MKRDTFVYRAYDADGVLLYVGITRNLDGRRRDHKAGSAWFPLAVRFRLDGPFERPVAQELERWRILRDRPRFNKNACPPKRDFDIRRCLLEGREMPWATRADVERVKAGEAA